ncbi:MAG: deoxyguanosinetriphosphate triphosphohydrolase [Nitrospiraceae bacterium]|nr:MAG: deoxyguanosinetriphosphate triphosphohydrolase [Nitrospiraceae bacterium]
MTIREQTEDIERSILHPKACLSSNSRGRQRKEKEGEIRTCFQRDRDRIIHSKAFRRLKHKTQVFLAPRGDHYRTRLTHTLEVSQIARTIARALRLNEDLTEAIALGHDLGHTPFGHAGEDILREIYPGGFAHYKQSLRVVDILERNGQGLNLTYEVRDGIVKHSKGKGEIFSSRGKNETLEGQIVRISDVIAYVNHDLDDAIRAGVLKRSGIPSEFFKIGDSQSKRIDTMVKDLIYCSLKSDLREITMSEGIRDVTYALRDFLYKYVYEGDVSKLEFRKARKILLDLYNYYIEHTDEVFREFPKEVTTDKNRIVCDFIAGMTDRYALMMYERNFLPQPWLVF